MSEYRPSEYWAARLDRHFTLRGTGHLSYSEAYNSWLYRAKRRALRRVMKPLPLPALSLDAGSGTGWVVSELLRCGGEVEGFDIAAVAVERLRDRFPESTFFRLALGEKSIPRDDDTFDLITAMDVAYHIVDDDFWAAGLRELARVLRPGGHIVFTDGLGDQDVNAADHVRFRAEQTWRALIEDTAMELTSTIPLYRWLSRDAEAPGFSRIPDRARGALEYMLELTVPRAPHMRCGVMIKRAD